MNSVNRILSVAVGLALAGASNAQSGNQGGMSGGTASPSITSPTAAAPAAASASHPLKSVRLSKLDGVNIYDSNARKIGKVEDMVMDPASGRIQHAIVSIGGVMGVGDKKYEVPASELSVFSRSAEDTVPVKVTLSKAPDALIPGKKLEKGSPYVMATKLIGTDLDDAKGKEIGEIEDLIVDLQSGEVQYAMVEFERDMAPHDKLFVFKLSELQQGKDGSKRVLDVSKEALGQVPSIEKQRLDKTDLSDPAWARPAEAAPKSN